MIINSAASWVQIAMIDNPNKELSSTSYKQQKLPAAYEALKKQGFKFINYEERILGEQAR